MAAARALRGADAGGAGVCWYAMGFLPMETLDGGGGGGMTGAPAVRGDDAEKDWSAVDGGV